MPDELASEMGLLMVAITAAVEELPSVGRCHMGRYGDGGAHAHPFFFGRPARMGQLRGSCLLDWEENLPAVPRTYASQRRPRRPPPPRELRRRRPGMGVLTAWR